MNIFQTTQHHDPNNNQNWGCGQVGTIASKGLKRLEIAKQIATTKAVRPVRPPAPIPAADSTYVVTFEVPAIAPTEVATKV